MKSTVILTGLLVIAATSIFAGCGSNRANSTVQKYAATGTLTYFEVHGVEGYTQQLLSAESDGLKALYVLDEKGFPDALLVITNDDAKVEFGTVIEYRTEEQRQTPALQFLDKEFLTSLHSNEKGFSRWKSSFAKLATRNNDKLKTIALSKSDIHTPFGLGHSGGGIVVDQIPQGACLCPLCGSVQQQCLKEVCNLINCMNENFPKGNFGACGDAASRTKTACELAQRL